MKEHGTALERTKQASRETAAQWLAVAGLGIGPVGAAFYAWDIGMKRGDIRILGVASYVAPLLSTAYLVLAGYAVASTSLVLAAVLVAGGGILAAKDMIARLSLVYNRARQAAITKELMEIIGGSEAIKE